MRDRTGLRQAWEGPDPQVDKSLTLPVRLRRGRVCGGRSGLLGATCSGLHTSGQYEGCDVLLSASV